MSNKVLRVTLDDDDPLIDDKELGVIVVNADAGTIDWIDTDGNPEHIAVFDATSASGLYMEKTTYDINNDNVVDNSEKLGGVNAGLYATQAWVLANTSGMSKLIYDANDDGIVDNSTRLGGQLPTYYASTAWVNANFGNMRKSTYDIANNGIVDDAEKLGNQSPAYYLNYVNLTNKPNIGDIGGMNISGEIPGDMLEYNGTHWVNKPVLDQGSF